MHILVRMHQEIAVADLVRDIKSSSSGWIHETFESLRDFQWQEGYGAFSASKSQMDKIKSYIQRQDAHHRKQDFKMEFIGFLEKHEIEYDPEKIWW